MKKVLLFLLLTVCIVPSVESQHIYAGCEQGFKKITSENEIDLFIPPEYIPTVYNTNIVMRGLEISPDGSFVIPFGDLDSFTVYSLEKEFELPDSTVEWNYLGNDNCSLVGALGYWSGQLIATTTFCAYRGPDFHEIIYQTSSSIGNRSGITSIGGNLYGIAANLNTGLISLGIWNLDGTVTEFYRILNAFTLQGITQRWSPDCRSQEVVWGTFQPSNRGNQTFYTYNILDSTVDTLYSFQYDEELPNSFPFVNLASWETHRKTCEVRLDLDEDDNSGRLGPHYAAAAGCNELVALTDSDLEIWTLDSTAIDSARISFLAYNSTDAAVIRVAENDLFYTVQRGDFSLGIYPATDSVPSHRDWEALLMTAQASLDRLSTDGRKVFVSTIYSAGLASDEAKSFIDYERQFSFAGRDTTVYLCADETVDPFTLLGPDATPGGNWSPALHELPDGSEVFSPEFLAYGTFAYETQNDSCRNDIAYVTLLPIPSLDNRVLYAGDTLLICPNDSIVWNPAATENVLFVRYEDDFPISERVLTEAGTYRALLIDEINGCDDWVALTIELSEATLMVVDTSIALGDTLQIGGQLITEAGEYDFYQPLASGSCDLRWRVSVSIISSLANNEAADRYTFSNVLVRGESTLRFFNEAGSELPSDQLVVYDITGRIIAQQSGQENPWMPHANTPPGVYFFRARIPDGEWVIGRLLVH